MSSEEWLQAQYSVLGSALIDSNLVAKVIHETTDRDYSGTCQMIYRVMRKQFLEGRTVDPVTVATELGPDHRQFLVELMSVVPSAANLDSYIQICREQAKILAIRNIGLQLSGLDKVEQIRKLLDEANGMLVDKPALKITTMHDALRSFSERHTRQAEYLSWPIRDFNDRIYSEAGDFLIIAGYPSTGKSAWALQCAWHWAARYRVGFFSLETSSEKLFDRQMAAVAGIGMGDIKRNQLSDDDWARFSSMSTEIMKRKLELIPAAGMSVADVRAVTMMRGYQIIIVDYLQLLQGNGINRTEQVTGISLGLHTLAQSLGVTVVALSQLKRKNDSDSPDMSDLRESGQIEQDADVVMILKLKEKNRPDGNRELYIAKNKEGTCPMIELAFDGKHQTFTKASKTGDVVSKFSADGKQARQRNREAANKDQMSMLPDTYPVPF